MKFEFVEFYRIVPKDKKRKSRHVGTVHIYVYSDLENFQFDLRGISVLRYKNKIWILPPRKTGFDEDEKKEVTYPCFSLPQEENYKEFKKFLDEVVEPIIREKLGLEPRLEKSLPLPA